jgi:hypothetical protein
MKLGGFVASAVLVFAFWAATPVQAQEVQCLGCEASQYTGNSYCQTYNGSWPNCETRCVGYTCSCTRGGVGGGCRRGADGTWYGFRVQDIFYMPLDRPFQSAFRVTSARMTQRLPPRPA